MPYKLNASRQHKFEKKRYKIKNWSAYTESLRRRGDVTVWLSSDVAASWSSEQRSTPGGQPVYADLTKDDVGDPTALPELFDQIDTPVSRFLGDGAYDGTPTFDLLTSRFGADVEIVIPAPKDGCSKPAIRA